MSQPMGVLNGNVNEISIYSFTLNRQITFKTFLTEFSDDYKPSWNSQEVYGRMDPIYTYKNTVRKISLAFDVPSYDLEDAVENSIKADKLINSLYPVYDESVASSTGADSRTGLGTATLSSPPFVRVKLANLIKNANREEDGDAKTTGLLGWIDGFNFKPELESGFFVGSQNNFLYAKLYKVSFTLNVVHEHALGYTVKSGRHVPRVTVKGDTSNPFPHSYGVFYRQPREPALGPSAIPPAIAAPPPPAADTPPIPTYYVPPPNNQVEIHTPQTSVYEATYNSYGTIK